MKAILLKKYIVMLMLAFLLPSCGKQTTLQENKKIARDHYKLCMLEFTDKSDNTQSAEQSYKKALMHIQRATNLDPCPEYLAIQATILFRLNDITTSRNLFEQALKLNSEPQLRPSILNNYACLLCNIGENEKALEIFNELEHDNQYLTPQAALFNKGKIYFEQNNLEMAMQEFSKAIGKAPDFLDARYFLALAACKTQNMALAKNELQTILFLEPNHEDAKKLSDQLAQGLEKNKL